MNPPTNAHPPSRPAQGGTPTPTGRPTWQQKTLGVLAGLVASVGTLAVTAAGFTLSFDAIRAVGVAAHIRPGWAWLLPVSVDGAMAVATVVVTVIRRLGGTPWYPWAVVVVGAGISVGCNALHAYREGGLKLDGWAWLAMGVSAIPALMLALCVHLLVVLAERVAAGGLVQILSGPREPVEIEATEQPPSAGVLTERRESRWDVAQPVGVNGGQPSSVAHNRPITPIAAIGPVETSPTGTPNTPTDRMGEHAHTPSEPPTRPVGTPSGPPSGPPNGAWATPNTPKADTPSTPNAPTGQLGVRPATPNPDEGGLGDDGLTDLQQTRLAQLAREFPGAVPGRDKVMAHMKARGHDGWSSKGQVDELIRELRSRRQTVAA